MTDGHQSPLQEAKSIITISAILVAVTCYVGAFKNAPVISPALFWLATQIYNWLPTLSRIPGEQIPMLVSSAAVGGVLWILVFRRTNNYTYAHAAFLRRFFGFVHPGEISSSRWRHLSTLTKMSSAFAVQTKGVGSAFHLEMKSKIA